MKISTSVPAFIELEEKNENTRYTVANLKIFYKGMTVDKRLFTEEFSNEILKTISYTPVVGYYSDDDEDFRGHNSVQYVYGVVPDDAVNDVHYVEEDGKTFAVVKVILFTERTDNIGEVAKKIVGKQQSLEINPKTVKYKVNRDTFGRLINIEFLHGEFIGLSVLGDDENPAFPGAGFFKAEDFDFTKCSAAFDNFLQFLHKDGGSIEVFNFEEYIAKMARTQTMQEFEQNLYAALEANEIYGYVVENTTDYAIVCTYQEKKKRCGYIKYPLTVAEDGAISLGEGEEVFARFLTQAEINALETPAAPVVAASSNVNEGNMSADEGEEPVATIATAAEGEGEGEGQVVEPAPSTCSAALSDEDRLELDSYRREAKKAKIGEYKEDISAEAFSRLMENVDSFSAVELENELNKEFRKEAKSRAEASAKTPTAFSITTQEPEYHEDNPLDVINKYNF